MPWRERVQLRTSETPAWGSALVVVAGAATVYWFVTYSGPYRWLAEWQLHLLGEYSVTLTVLVVLVGALLGAVLPAAILAQVIARARESDVDPEAAARKAAEASARAEAATAWMMRRFYRLVAATLAAGMVVVGLYFAVSGWLAGERIALDIAALERGDKPASRYVELYGVLLVDEAVGVQRGHGGTVKIYIPVVSETWRPGQPVRAYLETQRQAAELPTGRYEGMLGIGPLPGVAQTALTDRGLAPPDEYWVLDHRQKPDSQTYLGLVLLVWGILLGALTALVWANLERRNRRHHEHTAPR